MSSAARNFDVVIVGAGVVGCVMASLLISRKLTSPGGVAVVDPFLPGAPAADADWDARVYALSRASERLLKLCGVWQSLPRDRLAAYERMCVWDAAGEARGSGSLEFDCASGGEPNLGYIVDGRALQWQCLRTARNLGVVFLETELAAVQCDEFVNARLGDGRELRSKLLIGADGIESKVRRLLQVPTSGHTYAQDALVAHVRTAKTHDSTAWQRFLPTGPLAFLPLGDGRCSIVWSTSCAEAARLRSLPAADFNAALTHASGDTLGACELAGPLASFPLKLQYALHYVQSHVVLVGDAAHVVHPLAGQGLNLGLLDCAVLAEELSKAGGVGNFGDLRVLRRYERRRRSENVLAAAALDGLERLFSSPHPIGAAIRKAGLSAIARLPAVKHAIVRRALGLAGDVPNMLKNTS